MEKEINWEGAKIVSENISVEIGALHVKTTMSPEEYTEFIEEYQVKALETCIKITEDIQKIVMGIQEIATGIVTPPQTNTWPPGEE